MVYIISLSVHKQIKSVYTYGYKCYMLSFVSSLSGLVPYGRVWYKRVWYKM